MDVGLDMFIFDDRCATMSGSRPRPENVDESKGALLGLAFAADAARAMGCSIFGLEVKREDMIWFGGRAGGAPARSWSCSTGARVSLRGRFAGRSSTA